MSFATYNKPFFFVYGEGNKRKNRLLVFQKRKKRVYYTLQTHKPLFFTVMLDRVSMKINMYWLNVRFLDLPNEILYNILRKLDNMDVLYSLLNVDNRRLNMIVQEKTLTESLNFVLITITGDILSIADPMLDRFCINILSKIDYNIRSLILESESMERILLAANYLNLTELKLFNFKDKIASCYFTGKKKL